MAILESKFKTDLRKELQRRYPGCVIINIDPRRQQGLSDIIVLYGVAWAILEGKRNSKSSYRPNQKYYLERFDDLSFARSIYPENKEEVLKSLDEWFNHVNTSVPK